MLLPVAAQVLLLSDATETLAICVLGLIGLGLFTWGLIRVLHSLVEAATL